MIVQWRGGSSLCLPVLVVDVGLLDALVFSPAILEPDFDLSFAQSQSRRQLGASRPRNVFGRLELDFQPQGLLLRERRPLPPLAQAFPLPPGHWNTIKC